LNTATTLKNSTAIALGGFDGMHRGHQQLFKRLGENGAIVVIESGASSLTPNGYRNYHTHYPIKTFLLQEIKHLSAKEFVALLYETFPKLQKIVVGYDFYFGKDRAYSAYDLKELFDGEVVIVDEVKIDGISVHSRTIRSLIQEGKVTKAAKLLGYNYTIYGKKIQGQGIGSRELVATINLETKQFLLPKEGVYATFTRVDEEEHFYPSVSFIGHRCSTDGSFAIETHLLDTTVVCQEKAQISFVAFLRENQKFSSLQQLKNAIEDDIQNAKRLLQQRAL